MWLELFLSSLEIFPFYDRNFLIIFQKITDDLYSKIIFQKITDDLYSKIILQKIKDDLYFKKVRPHCILSTLGLLKILINSKILIIGHIGKYDLDIFYPSISPKFQVKLDLYFYRFCRKYFVKSVKFYHLWTETFEISHVFIIFELRRRK